MAEAILQPGRKPGDPHWTTGEPNAERRHRDKWALVRALRADGRREEAVEVLRQANREKRERVAA